MRLAPFLQAISNESGATGILVFTKEKDSDADRKAWGGNARDWEKVMNEKKYKGIGESKAWEKEPEAKLEDDGSIFFTSGTSVHSLCGAQYSAQSPLSILRFVHRTGLPKGVLGSQMASLAAIFQNISAVVRAVLRAGEDLQTFFTPKPNDIQKAALLAIPLFHTSGTQSGVLSTTMVGGKVVLMLKWDVEKGTWVPDWVLWRRTDSGVRSCRAY